MVTVLAVGLGVSAIVLGLFLLVAVALEASSPDVALMRRRMSVFGLLLIEAGALVLLVIGLALLQVMRW